MFNTLKILILAALLNITWIAAPAICAILFCLYCHIGPYEVLT
jgi:hypothetical protein